MSKRTLMLRIVTGLIIITVAGTGIAWFILKEEKPWLAFYVACCGGVLVLNFLVSLFLINKNFKK
ncbi:MAG: hypothetical protein LUG98_05705 [Tannerellaceae bacterium]|nr:hypothetical protein [Tannerellaceae bacterium]